MSKYKYTAFAFVYVNLSFFVLCEARWFVLEAILWLLIHDLCKTNDISITLFSNEIWMYGERYPSSVMVACLLFVCITTPSYFPFHGLKVQVRGRKNTFVSSCWRIFPSFVEYLQQTCTDSKSSNWSSWLDQADMQNILVFNLCMFLAL